MLPGEESALSGTEYEVRLGIGNHLLAFALTMTGKGEVRLKEKEIGFVAVVLGLYAKAVKTLRAIHLLCVHGLCEDAQALLRTLAEILAHIKYIGTDDREGRARQYVDFIIIQDQKLMNATEQNPGLKGMFSDDDKTLVRQRIEKAKARMPEEEFKKRYEAAAWHGRRIEEVMREVGLQSAYDLPFRLGSRAVHATDLFDHMFWDPKNGFLLKLFPGDKWARPVLTASILFFLQILEQVNAIGGFVAEEELQRVKEEVMTKLKETSGSASSQSSG